MFIGLIYISKNNDHDFKINLKKKERNNNDYLIKYVEHYKKKKKRFLKLNFNLLFNLPYNPLSLFLKKKHKMKLELLGSIYCAYI